MSKHIEKDEKKETKKTHKPEHKKEHKHKDKKVSHGPNLKNTIQVCTGKACSGRFSEYIKTRLESDKKFYNMPNIDVVNCPCTGNCKVGPCAIFGNEEVSIHVDPARASAAMVDMFKKKKATSTKKADKTSGY